MRRTPLPLLMLLSLAGCADLLDYGDVEFDDDAGAVEGGAVEGGAGQGGQGQGGANQGGANQGGANQGGANQGGANQGGANQGGANQGGANQGGANQGGANQGGANQGGANQGGANQGGANQGGANQGGASQGGANQGGANQGGANQGGANQGGANQGGAAGTGGTAGSGGSTSAVCTRWKADRVSLAEGAWSGSVSSCQAGDVASPGRENALRLVNLYRWMAGLPEVKTDSTRNSGAQKCALMMDANNTLSHSPPTSWTCYDATGASTAGKSNIASTPGVEAVDLYMIDPGNETTIGHRRWILSNSLGPIGLGSTSSYSCMWVIGGSGGGSKAWTAWPPPGDFPFEAVSVSWSSLDSTGWTLQSDSISLSGAKVSITDGGTDRPVTVTTLGANYGSSYAIRMLPKGWTAQAGHTYHVSVTGVSPAITYDVKMVACP